jgi:hypothetical protein
MASALAARSITTDDGMINGSAVIGATFCVGDGKQVHKFKSWTIAGSCEIEQAVRLLISTLKLNYFKP